MQLGYAVAIVLAPFANHLMTKWIEHDRAKRGDKPTLLGKILFRCGYWIGKVSRARRQHGTQTRSN